MAAVSTREIRKQFADVHAIDGISLVARDGEFMVLLGPSGCGKTTLLRIIAGLEKPTSGEVLIDGEVVNEMPPRARGIAMVFQSYGLYPHLTVWNNIAFPLRTQGMRREEIKRKVEWAARLLGIDHLLARRPRQLSGGERQRVALARSLASRFDSGSSSRNTVGSRTSARASATRCRSPPDSWRGRRCAR